MSKDLAESMLQKFANDPDWQQGLVEAINDLAALCAANAFARGFHDAEIALFDFETEQGISGVTKSWLKDQLLQAELARQASEIGEAVEGVRKPGKDSHCPEFENWLVEEADTVIRIGDTCAKRGLPLGEAVVAKLLYNMSRPYMHGKNS